MPRPRTPCACAAEALCYALSWISSFPVRLLARRHPWIAGLLLVVFLSVQLATAAVACTTGVGMLAPAVQAASMETMAHCADMAGHATAQPGTPTAAPASVQSDHQAALCMGHCQADTKHADHATPQLPAFVPLLVGIVIAAPLRESAALLATDGAAQPRAPPPPHAILHCCLRT